MKLASGLELLPHHLTELRASGLSDNTIEEAGIYSVTSRWVATQLGYSRLVENLPALAFPLLTVDRNGKPDLNEVRLKPDQPRIGEKGKPIKYESKKDTQNYLYIPEKALKVKNDPNIPLYITEGEKKALKACQEGLPTIALAGVWCWLTKDKASGESKPLQDFSQIALKNRELFIVFDSDFIEKPEVRWAEYKLTQELKKRGAIIKAIRLPPGENGEKVGFDDFLLARGAQEFGKLGVSKIEKPIKEDKQEEKQASFFSSAHLLFEEVLIGGEPYFLCYDTQTGEVEQVKGIKTTHGIILPVSGEELKLGAIILPSGVSEYNDTGTLLADVENHIKKYLDVTDSFRKFASYYVLLSWVYDRLNTLPYLRALGDTGCGKSRLLDVVGRLCYKPTIVSGCITPAPIYRMIRRWGGTMILDEADLKNSDEYHEVITILNCGFERGRPVIRATKDNPDKLQFLPTFGPKVFATRQRFKDPALEARCLTEIMQETTREDIPPLLSAKFYEEQQELRNKLLLFRFRNFHKINPEQATALDLGDIEPRLKQISGAFGAVFVNLAEVLKDYKAFIREHQRELIEQRAATPVGQVVEVLFTLFETGTFGTFGTIGTPGEEKLLEITPKDISSRLGITPQAVGQILKGLGLKTKQKKIGGEKKRCIVYDKQKLAILRRRYILEDELEGTDGTDGTRTQLKPDSSPVQGEF